MILLVGAFYGTRSNEPVYQGYPLSRWVNNYQPNSGDASSCNRSRRAATAVRAIGTNALPWMLAAIDHEPARWRIQLRRESAKLPVWLFNWSPIQNLQADDERAAATAMKAFQILGQDAAPAIPELERLARATHAPNTGTRALIALGYIGHEAVPTITNLIADLRIARGWAMQFCLQQLGTNAEAAVPVLIHHLAETNTSVVESSVLALGRFSFDADRCVPALSLALTNSDPTVRRTAAEGLAHFGAAARPALPALTNAVGDINPEVRRSAASAIKSINLESGG